MLLPVYLMPPACSGFVYTPLDDPVTKGDFGDISIASNMYVLYAEWSYDNFATLVEYATDRFDVWSAKLYSTSSGRPITGVVFYFSSAENALLAKMILC